MDLNHRLIETVRQYPLLYKNNASLADRKCSWNQIAQEMKMQEAILKTRWHFLREHYKRNVLSGNQVDNSQFPYKKEMEFLLPYLRPLPQEEVQSDQMIPIGIIKPEFVITEQDLENDSGNEEYVFLEVETLGMEYEVNNETVQHTSDNDLRKDLEEEQTQPMEQDRTNDLERIEEEIQMNQQESEKNDRDDKKQHNEKDVKPDLSQIKQATCNKNGSKEEEAVRNLIQEASEEVLEAKVEVREGDGSSDNDNRDDGRSSAGERCEDAIFGELVSAMLKKMPKERKRSVKRDIMNLLLT